MHEGETALERQHKLAVAELSRWVKEQWGRDSLSEPLLRSTYPKRPFVAGWRLQTDLSGIVFDLLVDRDFPFSQPRIGLGSAAKAHVWPHVEEDGLLCLSRANASHNAIEDTKIALCSAYELISLNLVEPSRQDFQNEFLSYWDRQPVEKGPRFTSILRASSPSRRIVVWRGKKCRIVAEDQQSLRDWYTNRFGGRSEPLVVEPAALIWLPKPLCPDEYPRTTSDLWKLASDDTDAKLLLESLAATSPNSIEAVIGSDSINGPSLAAVTLSSPKIGFPGKRKNTLQKGFRNGRVPPKEAARRFWNASTPVLPSKVGRADATWIHGRGRDPNHDKLKNSRVVVVGVGSVGAPVAIQLAMAGVGHLTVIDPELLTSANTGRHPLGSKFIGRHKAEALVGELRPNYPHHQFEFRNATWQEVNGTEPQLFSNASLLISATADWGTEDALNTWHVDRGKSPPILYSWTEEHACAGHAVLITARTSACLACGLDIHGSARIKVTDWTSDELLQEPGCGSVYQPYGPVELAHTVSLIAELALDALVDEKITTVRRVWACTSRFLASCGGRWNPEWLRLSNRGTEGGYQTSCEWPSNPECRTCGART